MGALALSWFIVDLLQHPIVGRTRCCRMLDKLNSVASPEKRKKRIQSYLCHQSITSIIRMDLIRKHAGRNCIVHINIVNMFPLGYVGLHNPRDGRFVSENFGVEHAQIKSSVMC